MTASAWLPDLVSFLTIEPSWNLIPSLEKLFFAKPEISSSSFGRILSKTSTTVVFAPSALKKLANSMPIAPDPMTKRLLGIRFGIKACLYDQTKSPSVAIPGNSLARAPVATTMLGAVISIGPSGPETEIV